MSDDPIRLRDDPRAASALRRDLSLAIKFSAAPAGFDAAAALARFDATRAGTPSHSNASATRARTARWWGVGAVGLATLIALGAWGARGLWSVNHTETVRIATGRADTARTNDTRDNPIEAPSPVPRAAREQSADPDTNVAALAHTAAHGSATPNAPSTVPANPAPASISTGTVATSTSSASAAPSSRSARRTTGNAIETGDDLLARDVRMLTDSYAALDVDPARALALANSGAHEFPTSSHRDEREAIAVRALVSLRRSGEARARGERFLSRSPTGPYASAVRQALYEGPRDH